MPHWVSGGITLLSLTEIVQSHAELLNLTGSVETHVHDCPLCTPENCCVISPDSLCVVSSS